MFERIFLSLFNCYKIKCMTHKRGKKSPLLNPKCIIFSQRKLNRSNRMHYAWKTFQPFNGFPIAHDSDATMFNVFLSFWFYFISTIHWAYGNSTESNGKVHSIFCLLLFRKQNEWKKNLCEINKQIYHQRFVNVIIVSCGIGWNAYVIHRYYGIGKLPKR